MHIHDVSYEDLIYSPERKVRELIEACDLEWDPQCMKFLKNRRPIQTASFWQARQPIYSTSIGRWQNYADHMGKAKEILDSLEG